MSNQQKENERHLVRVELKYCEHCGGLWIRESGTGVYCERCQPKVADLPVPKKPRRLILPRGSRPRVEDYPAPEELTDLDAVGGVA